MSFPRKYKSYSVYDFMKATGFDVDQVLQSLASGKLHWQKVQYRQHPLDFYFSKPEIFRCMTENGLVTERLMSRILVHGTDPHGQRPTMEEWINGEPMLFDLQVVNEPRYEDLLIKIGEGPALLLLWQIQQSDEYLRGIIDAARRSLCGRKMGIIVLYHEGPIRDITVDLQISDESSPGDVLLKIIEIVDAQ